MKKLLMLIAGAALCLLGAGPAAAHVEPSVHGAPAGSFLTFTLHIGHGCDDPGGDTETVEVQLPDGVDEATPMWIPGWEASVQDGVVTWEGGPLPTDQYLDFGLSIQVPDTPGETMRFPTIQTCASGEELAWIEETVEGGEEPEHPAPVIEVTESTGDPHGGDEEGDDHGDEEAAAAPADDDDDRQGVAAAAFVFGAAGLAFGLLGFFRSRQAG